MNQLTRKERERLQRQTDIVNAAEEIFARDGFEHASMNQIAEKSEFTKRTLYQYFEDKSDLYLTVALRLYNEMYTGLTQIDLEGMNGFDKVKTCFDAYYLFFKTNASKFRIVYDIGNVRKTSENPKIQEFLKIDKMMFENLQSLVEEGQKDGSITKEYNAMQTTTSIMFLVTGFLNQLTITGENFAKHLDITLDQLASNVLGLVCAALRP